MINFQSYWVQDIVNMDLEYLKEFQIQTDALFLLEINKSMILMKTIRKKPKKNSKKHTENYQQIIFFFIIMILKKNLMRLTTKLPNKLIIKDLNTKIKFKL